jgi:hypothetical protein
VLAAADLKVHRHSQTQKMSTCACNKTIVALHPDATPRSRSVRFKGFICICLLKAHPEHYLKLKVSKTPMVGEIANFMSWVDAYYEVDPKTKTVRRVWGKLASNECGGCKNLSRRGSSARFVRTTRQD